MDTCTLTIVFTIATLGCWQPETCKPSPDQARVLCIPKPCKPTKPLSWTCRRPDDTTYQWTSPSEWDVLEEK